MPTINQWRTLLQDSLAEINLLPNVFGEVLRVWAFEGNPWEGFYSASNPPVMRSGFAPTPIPQEAQFSDYDAWFVHAQYGIEVGWAYSPTGPLITFRYDGRTLTNNTGDSDYGWGWV